MSHVARRRLTPAEVLGVAQSLHGQGRLAEAEPAYRYVLAHTPDDPSALSGLGALSLTLGRAHEAEDLLRRARWRSIPVPPRPATASA